jgi:hypothetical protein
VAFAAWCEGNFDPETMKFLRAQPKTRKDVLAGTVVLRRDIPDLLTPEFAQALRVWTDYKRFGLPYHGGWAEQPAPLITLIRLFEGEFQTWQESKKHDSRRTPPKGKGRDR